MTAVIRLLRGLSYAFLPAELVLLVCLVAGVRIPPAALAVAELAGLALLLTGSAVFLRLWRRGGSARQALGELVPEPVLRLVGHELRLMASLVRWVGRRRVGVRPGDQVFPHARDQAALLYGFAFVCLVETVGMSYLLADWPVAHAIMLVVDVYTVLFVLGLHAASVTRPHLLTADGLRLRQAAHVDLLVPLDRIASVRYELVFSHEKKEGELNLAVGSQTSLTIELTEPVDAPRFLGAPRPVRIVRCHADDARTLYRALSQAVAAAADAGTAVAAAADAGTAVTAAADAGTGVAQPADTRTAVAQPADTRTAAAQPADTRTAAAQPAVTPVRTGPSPTPGPPV
ncbi:hypothetical protein ACIPPS_18165 [Streptomyces sp. NPDC090127]|uniref:hypothetical protein n=1 Tax=Streptomyces sp. NPDC090127 TaxID=3365953 RepID=UPI00380D4325